MLIILIKCSVRNCSKNKYLFYKSTYLYQKCHFESNSRPLCKMYPSPLRIDILKKNQKRSWYKNYCTTNYTFVQCVHWFCSSDVEAYLCAVSFSFCPPQTCFDRYIFQRWWILQSRWLNHLAGLWWSSLDHTITSSS